MKKKISLLLIVVVVLQLTTALQFASAGFDNFTNSGEYSEEQFDDVNEEQWFAPFVEDAFNYGIINGKSAGVFDPGGALKLGEALKLVVRFSCIYSHGEANFTEQTPYYKVYADYALNNGILEESGDYNAPVSRARFAQLICNALPAETLLAINEIPDYAVCDVASGDSYYDSVYTLYRAGILTGADAYGSFLPNSNLSRAEAGAIMVRLIDRNYRVRFKMPSRLPAEMIFSRSAQAVFLIETCDKNGDIIRTGTGFFLETDTVAPPTDRGYAVTNLHVLENAVRATARMMNGEVCDILGAYAVSPEYNLAILSLDITMLNVEKPIGLKLADSDLIEVGNTVYALGNPMDLANSITEGVIANKEREVEGETLVQFSAPISFGSGGSPVLNTRGQVIGVACSSFSYGQNMNLAVPVNRIKTMKIGKLITLDELLVVELD